MNWFTQEISRIPRVGAFPFQVKELYFCSHLYAKHERRAITPGDIFEINIRLESNASCCRDAINGEVLNLPYPNVAWKRPGQLQVLDGGRFLNTIAFAWSATDIAEFERLGLMPEENASGFLMTQKISKLVSEFRSLVFKLHTPGVADQVDWVCFKLHRELLYATRQKPPEADKSAILENIALWFQLHLNEDFSIEEVALSYGFSRSAFFREWKQKFDLSPVQYILDMKLNSAKMLLEKTDLPISEIVREVRFSGLNAFHKRFFRKFAMTPGQFRIQNRNF